MQPLQVDYPPSNDPYSVDGSMNDLSTFDDQLYGESQMPKVSSFWGQWKWAIIVGSVIAVGLPLIGIRAFLQPRTYEPIQAEEAVPVRTQVSALGRLEPKGGVLDVGMPLGSIAEAVLVIEGDQVTEGQVLAYLNGYAERVANRDLIASQIQEAEQQLATSLAFEQAQVQAAQTNLAMTEAPQTNAIAAQEAQIRRLQVQRDQAQVDFDRFDQLYQEGAIAKQDVDQRQSQVNQLQEDIAQAQATLERLKATRRQAIDNAQADVQVAQANLTQVQGRNQVESIRRSLALAEAQLEQSIIRAPQDGQVLRIFTKTGASAIENGLGGGTLLQLGNTDEMYAVAEVYEADVSLIQVGQRATVISRNQAFTDELTGTVEFIGQQIFKNNILNDDPAALNDARVVEVKIRLDAVDSEALRTNLQVDIRIDLDEANAQAVLDAPSTEGRQG